MPLMPQHLLPRIAAPLIVGCLAATLLAAPPASADDPAVSATSPASLESPDPSAVLDVAEAALAGETEPSVISETVVVESPTLALADLAEVYDELTAPEQRRADQILARPDGAGGVDVGKWSTSATPAPPLCGPHVCVHYVTDTSDQASTSWATTTLNVMESVWNYEVNTLGYRAPAADGIKGEETGGATVGKFDVYLSNIGAERYYGYCATESAVPGQTLRASGYCVLDNNFTEFVLGPTASLQVTAAHEFFHAIQFNYDALEDRWLMEATATWMEERYADAINDNRQYLKYGQSSQPRVPLDTYGGLTHYGNWLFFERLSRKYGVGSVLSIWNRLDATKGKTDQYSLQGVKNFLISQGTTLPKFYAHFAAGNLSPAKHYSEGSAYGATKVVRGFKLKGARKAVGKQKATLRHLTSKSYRFTPAASLRAKKLRILVDGPDAKSGPAAVAYVYLKNGKITKKLITLNKRGVGSAAVNFRSKKVKRVTLTIVNASSRYACWQGGIYACGGRAKDDASKFTFSARAVG